jgi:hypothetical protein
MAEHRGGAHGHQGALGRVGGPRSGAAQRQQVGLCVFDRGGNWQGADDLTGATGVAQFSGPGTWGHL